MATAIITLRIMPESPETDLSKIETEALKHIREFAGERETKISIEPVAFGLKSLNIIFVMDETLGSTEALENDISSVKGVQSVEVTDVRRAIG